jgi:Immunity protein 52
VILTTSSLADPAPDTDVVSYRIFRAALLAIVDAWQPDMAEAYPRQLMEMNVENSYFPKAWIQYLVPSLAQKIAPPSTALVEHLPNGALLMTATTETFDVKNPQHLAVAGDMAAAMAPLDRLFRPSEGQSV